MPTPEESDPDQTDPEQGHAQGPLPTLRVGSVALPDPVGGGLDVWALHHDGGVRCLLDTRVEAGERLG